MVFALKCMAGKATLMPGKQQSPHFISLTRLLFVFCPCRVNDAVFADHLQADHDFLVDNDMYIDADRFPSYFDPNWDFNFTKFRLGTDQAHVRGNRPYLRPIGSRRLVSLWSCVGTTQSNALQVSHQGRGIL